MLAGHDTTHPRIFFRPRRDTIQPSHNRTPTPHQHGAPALSIDALHGHTLTCPPGPPLGRRKQDPKSMRGESALPVSVTRGKDE